MSWMYFNHRILLEAKKPSVPLLERMSFLGIYSNNLDEFFRVRVATLERIMELTQSGKSVQAAQKKAEATLQEIYKLNKRYASEFDQEYGRVVHDLALEGIHIVKDSELTPEQADFVLRYYMEELNGFTNPLILSKFNRLWEMDDSIIYLAIKMDYPATVKGKPVTRHDYSIISVSFTGSKRFVRLPDVNGEAYVILVDDIIRYCLPRIFAGSNYTSFSAYTFKFTKDAEMEVDSEYSAGIMQRISKALKTRKRGEALRFVYDEKMPKDLVQKLKKMLNLDKRDSISPGRRYHNMKDLMAFPLCDRPHLKYPPVQQLLISDLSGPGSAFAAVKTKDRLIHVPYHSFNMFLRLLREAAILPHVTEISISIYRLAKNSKVIQALLAAARNGKRVTVMIELMARFDEASNLDWSRIMQEAGIKVIFGPEGLKVHSKLLHITSTQGDIACISTGNFHEGNAKVYTDYTLMTAKLPIVREVAQAFEFIEKPYMEADFKELVVSPHATRKWFLSFLQFEIDQANRGRNAYLKAKLNHITDPECVLKIYEAAAAGVKIDLLVRGNCSLITNAPRLNGNLMVVGIIDRYLEHSRIFIFCHAEEKRAFIGSADLMPRNLDTRIEVITPVYDLDLVADLERTVDFGLLDSSQGRYVTGDGANHPVLNPNSDQLFRSQDAIYSAYCQQEDTGTLLNY